MKTSADPFKKVMELNVSTGMLYKSCKLSVEWQAWGS